MKRERETTHENIYYIQDFLYIFFKKNTYITAHAKEHTLRSTGHRFPENVRILSDVLVPFQYRMAKVTLTILPLTTHTDFKSVFLIPSFSKKER